MTEPAPRANPFVGLAETSLRFVLLSLATLAAASYSWQYIHPTLRGREMVAALSKCSPLSLTEPSPPYRTEYARCYAQEIAGPLGVSITVGVALTLGATLVIFLLGPVVLRRRRRLVPIGTAPGTKEITADVSRLATRLASAEPDVLLDPSPEASARVIRGAAGSPSLVLAQGMTAAHQHQPATFRAVVAHELSHVRNGDVRLAELAVAAWWALALAVVAPYLVAAFAGGHPGSVVPVIVKFLIILVLARALRNALLRSRELEADIRASTLPDVRPALEGLLNRQTSRRRVSIWSAHPGGPARRLAVQDPSVVLQSAGANLLALGAVGYFLVPGISFWLQQFSHGRPISTTVFSAVSWLVALGVGTGVWAIGWREAVAERVRGATSGRAVQDATWLTAGILVGALVVPVPRTTLGMFDPHSVVQWLSMAAVVYLGGLLTLVVGRAVARRLTARAARLGHARLLNLLGALILASLTAVIFDAVRKFVVFSAEGMRLSDSLLVTTVSVVLDPTVWILLGVFALALLATVPLRPTAPGTVMSWMVLPDQEPAVLVDDPLRPHK